MNNEYIKKWRLANIDKWKATQRRYRTSKKGRQTTNLAVKRWRLNNPQKYRLRKRHELDKLKYKRALLRIIRTNKYIKEYESKHRQI